MARALGVPDAPFVLERPRDEGHGDLATNLALLIAKTRRTNPRPVAEEVVGSLAFQPGVVERIEIAGPGFINFWLARDHLAAALSAIVRAGEGYGRATLNGKPLYQEPIGIVMLVIMGIMELAGVLWMKKLVKVDV